MALVELLLCFIARMKMKINDNFYNVLC